MQLSKYQCINTKQEYTIRAAKIQQIFQTTSFFYLIIIKGTSINHPKGVRYE